MNQQQTNSTHMYAYWKKKMGEEKLLEIYTQIIQSNRQNSQYGNFIVHTIPQMFSL